MAITGRFFSSSYYLTQNTDVANRWAGTALDHYILYGALENRAPNSWFNAQYYRAQNSDLGSMTAAQLFDHYEDFGYAEGRAPSSTYANFNEALYLSTYSDLGTAGIVANTALNHYLMFGASENRVAKNDDGSTITGTTTTTGTTFTLTTSSDNPTLTTLNDTINGSVSATTADNTLTLTDVIDGSTGTDTLNVMAAVLAADISVPSAGLKNIETVNIRAIDADGTVGADAATFVSVAGVTAVNADRNSSNVTVTALATGASVGMIGDGSVSNGILSYAYSTATADQIINISNGTSSAGVASITATASTGVTKATINSTGAANSVDTIKLDSAGGNTVTSLTVNAATNLTAVLTAGDFAATAALTVSGAATAVSLGTAFDGKTIDASGLTAGGLTIGLSTATTSFKGGAGNDTVTSAAVAATTAGAVDAGAGTADLLSVAASTDVDTAAETAVYTNFEVLRNSHNTDLDVSLISGITSVQLNNAAAGATKLTAAQAENIKVLVSNATNTISLTTATGTSDVLGLTLENATAAAVATPIDVTALTVTGFETLNVVSSSGVKAGGTGAGNDLAFAAAGDVKAINVSGAYDLTIAAAGLTTATTITSTQTGTAALYVSGNLVTGSAVTGSDGADAFILGTGFATYTGGAGNDTMSGTQAQINTGANYNAVDGGLGTDTLTFTGAGAITIVDNTLSKITGFEKIVIVDTTTQNQSITTGGWFDAAFKTNGVNLTTNSTNGTVTIDMTSFTGAATITATTTGVGGGAADGRINIQTGSGADKVTVTDAATTTTNVLSTFAGNDTIIGSLAAETITGGTGQDTMTGGGTTANTFAFAKGDTGLPSATVFDTITDFSAVAANLITTGSQLVLGSASTAASGMAGLGAANGVKATFNAADTTFAQHLAAVENALTGNTATAWETAIWVEAATDTYVFISDGVAGIGANDLLIKLAGIDGTAAGFDVATLSGTDFTLA